MRTSTQKDIMAKVVSIIITTSEENTGAFGVRVDNDESV